MPRSALELRPANVVPRQRHSFNSIQHEEPQAMSIRRLPEDVIDKIKSSVVIISLNGVACGLLANSLDAGATKVNISIDYSRGNCIVEDNGSGIPPQEFQPDGGLGKLHHSSRFPPRSSVHGRQGDFLASLATLSLLSITSRHHGRVSSNTVSIHQSKVLARHLPSPPELRLVNFDYGTRVIVRDLFGSMPVRVKQRAAMSERPSLDKEWAKLIRDVVVLLLSWPTGVNVSLRDTVTQRELRFRPSEKSDIISRTSRLLTQASLADSGDVNAWVPVSASSGPVNVKGCICETPSATRRTQFLSLGIHPIYNEYGTNVLFEEINKVFGNSSFGMVEELDNSKDRGSPKLDDFTGKELRARKAIERWPMFYFKITLAGWADAFAVDDVLNDRAPELTTIIDLLKAVCYGFLKKHHFRPRKVRLAPEESPFSTARTLSQSRTGPRRQSSPVSRSTRNSVLSPASSSNSTPSRTESPFDGWHRIKLGAATPFNTSDKSLNLRQKQAERSSSEPLIGEDGTLLRKPFNDPSPEPEAAGDERHFTLCASTEGPTEFGDITARAETNHPASPHEVSSETDAPLGKRRRLDANQKPEQSQWLKKVVQSWENPVFENVQSSIPRLSNESLERPPSNHKGSCHCGGGDGDAVMFESASMNLAGRVSKQALSQATVISQVDKKFILVKLPLDGVVSKDKGQTAALVMLDQHAVDERCRLEDLMANYFVRNAAGALRADVESLERPIVFEVLAKERDLLDQHREHFADWGIVFQVHRQSTKVIVTALPPSILERCRLEPRLLVDVLRTEIWKIVDDGIPSRTHLSASQVDKPWITNFHGCPQGILDMLYSRACRSAIMFNDVLSNDECEKLLARLAKCAFPFQCAHGRPSMAPLVDLGAGGRLGSWEEGRIERKSWGKWMHT